MLANELPFEILANIARLLPARDISSGSLVCQSWYQPFSDSLWHTVKIQSRPNLEALCNHLSGPNNHKVVRQLEIGAQLQLEAKELNIMLQSLHSLHTLVLATGSISASCFKQEMAWSKWSSLQRLDFYAYNNDPEHVIRILSCLPALRQLTYLTNRSGEASLHLYDMERIHSYLPGLEKLTLSANLALLGTDDIQTMSGLTVKPARKLKHVKFAFGCVDLRWASYWALKYPNLRMLEWNPYHDSTRNYSYVDEAAEMLCYIPSSFSHLETIRLLEASRNRRLHQPFVELMSRFGRGFRRLEYDIAFDDQYYATTDGIKEVLRDGLSNRVETLDMRVYYPIQGPNTLFPFVMGVCPSLLHLKLQAFDIDFAIDVLLDNCMALRTLNITCRTIALSKSSSLITTTKTHSLQSFKFNEGTTEPAVFNYISNRCRQLTDMHLNRVKVLGKISDTAGSLAIDMSHTHFQQLQLDQISYLSSPLGSECKNKMHFISFTQQILSEREWYHWNGYWSCHEMSNPHRRLPNDQVKYVEEYYGSFPSRRTPSLCQHRQLYINSYVASTAWKDDLNRGYIDVHCGSIDSLVLKN
ncbi:hypothetical protein CLU79DRAFT_765669 [Phycomyces nitens]|nr:hypothetical protein CLU79DRAFT_765669 [Phycomyces nitens]